MKKKMMKNIAVVVKAVAIKSAGSCSPWGHQPVVPAKLLKK